MILIDITAVDGELRLARQQAIADGVLPDFAAQSLAPGDMASDKNLALDATPALLADVQCASEARAWAERLASGAPGHDSGVLLWVDSLWGAFDIGEILRELEGHVAGAHCDTDGFLFRFIEAFRLYPEFVLPDRDDMNDATHFLRSFHQLVASACKRRGIRYCNVAPGGDEIDEFRIEAADLLLVPRGRITERGMRLNIRTGLDYLSGSAGNAGSDEEALRSLSSARLAAAQLWQWVRHETGVLDVGRIVTATLFASLLEEELESLGQVPEVEAAAEVLSATVLDESFTMHAVFQAENSNGPAQQ